MTRLIWILYITGLIWLAFSAKGHAVTQIVDDPTEAPTAVPTQTPTLTPTAMPIVIRLAQSSEADPRNPVVGEEFSLIVRIVNDSSVDLQDVTVYIQDINSYWALVPTDGLYSVSWLELLRGVPKSFERRFAYRSVSTSGREIEIKVEFLYLEGDEPIPGVWTDTITLQVLAPTATPTETLVPTPTDTDTPIPTAAPTETLVPTPTDTDTPIPTASPTEILVPAATVTATPSVTATSVLTQSTPSPTPTQSPELETSEEETPPACGCDEDTNTEADDAAACDDQLVDREIDAAHAMPSPQHLLLELGDTPLAVSPGDFFTMSLQVRNVLAFTEVSDIVMTWQGFCFAKNETIHIFLHASALNWPVADVAAGEISTSTEKEFYVKECACSGVYTGLLKVSYMVGGMRRFYKQLFPIYLYVKPRNGNANGQGGE